MAVFAFMASVEGLAVPSQLPLLQRFPLALLLLLVVAICTAVLLASYKPTVLLNAAYKLHVLTAAGLVGWWLDHVLLFPYARPAGYLQHHDWRRGPITSDSLPHFPVISGCGGLFIAACCRRAVVVGLAMLAASLVL